MGGSGKKLPGGGARHKANTPRPTAALGAGPIPHPLRLVVGQRFVPLKARRRRALTITRVEREGRVHAVKEDGARERICLQAARLLASDEQGTGIHYRFIGYRPGRRYRTFANVVAADGKTLTLVLPEWHPARTVAYTARLLPHASVGAWLALSADLGQAQAGALNPADVRPCRDPGGDRCRRPDPVAVNGPTSSAPRSPARWGRGCGDIVIEALDRWRKTAGGLVEVHVAPNVLLRPGARVYVPGDGNRFVVAFREVVASDPTPNGIRVRCRPQLHTLDTRIPLRGPLLSGRWRWRWWPQDLERPGCSALLCAFDYDPVEHCDDRRWPGGSTPFAAAREDRGPRLRRTGG